MDASEVQAAAPSRRVAVWGLASALLTAGLSYVLQIAVGRLMPPALFSEAQSLLGLYLMLATAVVPLLMVITRRVVDDGVAGRLADSRALMHGLLRLTVGVGAVVMAAAWVGRHAAADLLAISDPDALPVFVLSTVSSVLYLICVSVVLGRLRWRAGAILPVALGTVRLAASIVLVMAGYAVAGVFAAITISTAVCGVIAYALATRGLPRGGVYRPLRGADLGLAFSINTAFWYLVHVDGIYVNSQLPALAASGYGAIATLARPVVYFPASINNLFFPFLAATAQPADRRRVLVRMLAIAAAFSIAGVAVVATIPSFLITLTFGASYVGLADRLGLVAAALTAFAVLNVVLYDAMTRHDRLVAGTFVAAAVLATVLLVLVQPELPGMLAILAGCALGPLGLGVARMGR